MIVDKYGDEWTADKIRDAIHDILAEYYWESAYEDFVDHYELDSQAVQDELYGEGTC